MSIHTYLTYHIFAFGAGFLLDLLLGDPEWLYHPVRIIGNFITFLENVLNNNNSNKDNSNKDNSNKDNSKQRALLSKGCLLVVLVLLGTMAVAVLLLAGAYRIHAYLGMAVEMLLTWQILAVKSLRVESMQVYTCLVSKDECSSSADGSLVAARKAVSRIVGRDTGQLDEAGVIRAAVETVAENTSDGVIAPMLCLALGGPILGFAYKAVNTMDSMVGYKNERYLYFGRTAARLDDAVNFLPARISAGLMLAVCGVSREFDGKRAWRIYKRDRRNHASPNSAQTESVCAGALGLRLAGPASYFGKRVEKPYIGDEIRQIEPEDIRRVNRLMFGTAWLCAVLCIGILGSIWWIMG